MPRPRLAAVAAAMLLSAAPALAQSSAPDPSGPTLAVLDLENGGSIGPDAQDISQLGKALSTMLTTEMMKNDRVQMVERDQIRQLVEEQKLSLSGMADAATAVQVGKLLGAKFMVFGSYADVFSNLRIDVRVVDVETGRVSRAQEVTDKRENLFKSVTQLSQKLFRDLKLEPSRPVQASPAVPARAALLFSRALGYEDAGEKDRAAEMYRKALEAFPQYDEAQKRLARLEAR